MEEVVLRGEKCLLRPYRMADLDELVRLADNVKVWRNLTDLFPHPYTRESAFDWIQHCLDSAPPVRDFAIEVDGHYAGGAGAQPKQDVLRRNVEVGYWLGEEFWGRGIATDACALISAYALKTFRPVRLEATVFAWNPRSGRVLEKNGFHLEARHEARISKGGEITDELMYARIHREGRAKQES